MALPAGVKVRLGLYGFCFLGFTDDFLANLLRTMQVTCSASCQAEHKGIKSLASELPLCSQWPWLLLFQVMNFLLVLSWRILWEQLSCCIWPWPLLELFLLTLPLPPLLSLPPLCYFESMILRKIQHISLFVNCRPQIHYTSELVTLFSVHIVGLMETEACGETSTQNTAC